MAYNKEELYAALDEYIRSPHNINSITISNLTSKFFVSKSFISRYAKDRGFKSFIELKYYYQYRNYHFDSISYSDRRYTYYYWQLSLFDFSYFSFIESFKNKIVLIDYSIETKSSAQQFSLSLQKYYNNFFIIHNKEDIEVRLQLNIPLVIITIGHNNVIVENDNITYFHFPLIIYSQKNIKSKNTFPILTTDNTSAFPNNTLSQVGLINFLEELCTYIYDVYPPFQIYDVPKTEF